MPIDATYFTQEVSKLGETLESFIRSNQEDFSKDGINHLVKMNLGSRTNFINKEYHLDQLQGSIKGKKITCLSGSFEFDAKIAAPGSKSLKGVKQIVARSIAPLSLKIATFERQNENDQDCSSFHIVLKSKVQPKKDQKVKPKKKQVKAHNLQVKQMAQMFEAVKLFA